MSEQNPNIPNTTSLEQKQIRRFQLSPKQHQFFMGGRAAIQRMNDQMNGALQIICSDNDLTGSKISLSEDGTEILIED